MKNSEPHRREAPFSSGYRKHRTLTYCSAGTTISKSQFTLFEQYSWVLHCYQYPDCPDHLAVESGAESLPCVLGLLLIGKNLSPKCWERCPSWILPLNHLGHQKFYFDAFLHWFAGQETRKWPFRVLPNPFKAAEPIPCRHSQLRVP